MARPVVVTDLREPLIDVHRRMMRARLVLMAVWIAGWIVAGVLYRHGWLATGILLATGPGVWVVYVAVESRRRPGRREPVTRRGAAALGAGGDR
jgi:hypothetical protein